MRIICFTNHQQHACYQEWVGDLIFEFAVAYELAKANTYFTKRMVHPMTFKSRSNESQRRFLYA